MRNVVGPIFFLAFLALFSVPQMEANAASSKQFLTALEGNWRGGGTVVFGRKDKKFKLRCALKNTLNKGKRIISVKGKCAASQGKRSFSASMGYAATGKGVTAKAIRATGTSSNASTRAVFNGSRLTVTSKFIESQTNRPITTRGTITGSKSRLKISFEEKKEGKWKRVGSLSFKR